MKKGDLFIVSVGEYSDYEIKAMFKCLKDFNIKALIKQFESDNQIKLEVHDDCAGRTRAVPCINGKRVDDIHSRFLLWLNLAGYAEELGFDVVHLNNSPWEKLDIS